MCQRAIPLHVRYATLWHLRQQQAQHRQAAAAAAGGDIAAAGQQPGAAEGIPGLQILVQQMQVRNGHKLLIELAVGGAG